MAEAKAREPDGGYSLGSIVLHWTSSLVIAVMLCLGSSIGSDSSGALLAMHITIGSVSYPLLWFRIFWRLRRGEPASLNAGSRWGLQAVARGVHVLTLACLAGMLASGPLLAWSMDEPISIFGWFVLRSPIGAFPAWTSGLLQIHVTCAIALASLVGLHILGVLKHVLIDNDGLVDRILIPVKLNRGKASPAGGGGDR